jgi:hypothetical protein
VPSCVFDKLGRAAGEKRLRKTAVVDDVNIIMILYLLLSQKSPPCTYVLRNVY